MHLDKEHVFEMAQEGAKLTKEEQVHLRNCDECGNLYRTFVLHRYYGRGPYRPLSEYLQADREPITLTCVL